MEQVTLGQLKVEGLMGHVEDMYRKYIMSK
ncbi:hypothetical protein SAMN05216582_12840 [Selenomonas ruminantium]|uniref:Uncharacterized protein n=1 Tax=Selenomonas ruminantium TaxID=971 RepID=A0A1M6WV56_SELRU|nr:hypothetical protein SAMN05216582_12840 [Selenomonas ruminantium]